MTSVNCSRPSPLPCPFPQTSGSGWNLTISETRPFPTASVRVSHTPIYSHLAQSRTSAQPTPAPTPRLRGAAALAPRCLLGSALPPRRPAASAPRSPRRRLQPGCRATPPRPAPPRLHRRSRWRTHQRSPPPPSPPPPARPLGQPGPWRTDAPRCPGPGTRARAQAAAGPHRGALLGPAEDCRIGRREEGSGEPPQPRTHQVQGNRSRCHFWGEPLPPLARLPSVFYTTSKSRLSPRGAHQASLVASAAAHPAQRDLAQPAFAVRLRAGGRAAHLRVPLHHSAAEAAGVLIFQLVLWRLWRFSWGTSGESLESGRRSDWRWAVNDKGWRVMLEWQWNGSS